MEPQARNVGLVAGGDLDASSAWMAKYGADRGNLFGEHEGKAAQGVDGLLDFGDPSIVMLVLDAADDLLDEVFNGDDPISAGEFVNDDREMDSTGPHVGQNIERAARLGHVKRLAHQHRPVARRRLAVGQEGKDVL